MIWRFECDHDALLFKMHKFIFTSDLFTSGFTILHTVYFSTCIIIYEFYSDNSVATGKMKGKEKMLLRTLHISIMFYITLSGTL